MAQQLRALGALIGNQAPLPAPTSHSQPSVTSVPGDLTLATSLSRHQTCTWYTYIHAGKYLYISKTK